MSGASRQLSDGTNVAREKNDATIELAVEAVEP